MSIPPPLPDQLILEGIRRRDEAVLRQVQEEYRPRILEMVRSKGGSEEDARDVYQEGIIAVFINVQEPGFQLTSSFFTYLYAVCYFQWLKIHRRKKRAAEVSLDDVLILTVVDDAKEAFERSERYVLYLEKLWELGAKCRDLLQLSIVEEKEPEEIVALLGFGSLGYLYKRKSKCKDQLQELIRQDPRYRELANSKL